MKGKDYRQMIEDAKTSAEAHNILCEVDEIIPKVEAAQEDYSDWSDDELGEYLEMLYNVKSYYIKHFNELHTPKELEELDTMVI